MKTMRCKNEACPRPREMKPLEQTEHWVFVCETCHSVQVWDKKRPEIGGTLGAGSAPNGRRSVVGRGF